MAETLKPIAEMVAERPDVDNTEVFARAWQLLGALKGKIDARFELVPDPSSEPVHEYGTLSGSGPVGHLHTYTGPEIDWLVHSWMGDPAHTFTNMHLTVWLGAQSKVPHLGIAWGTVPDLWFYLDYLPRADLAVDLEHLDRYYTPINERWLDLREQIDLPVFVSRDLYIRESLTDIVLCHHGPADIAFPVLEALAHEHVDRWLGWVDQGDPVPVAERAALSARDEAVRRNIAERDPANVMGVQLFGAELTERLVRTLWGADRQNTRSGFVG